MDLSEYIQPGMVEEISFQVEPEYTAQHIGSGSLRVLATPILIRFMEATSHRLLARRLPEGWSSVGTLVEVRHVAPTPAGETVRVRTEVVQVDGLRVTFSVNAWDPVEQVGEGRHQRMVIDEARFLKRVAAKSAGGDAS